MKIATRTLGAAIAALVLALGSVPATARGQQGARGAHVVVGGHWAGHPWHGHRHWGPGPFWGSVGIGIGLGYYYGGPWYPGYYGGPWYPGYYGGPWYAGYVVTQAPPGVYYEGQVPAREPVAKAPPDPIIYPRNGQSAAQTEADRQECNRWATTQPSAMADASVFHRATLACMEGRGYTLR